MILSMKPQSQNPLAGRGERPPFKRHPSAVSLRRSIESETWNAMPLHARLTLTSSRVTQPLMGGVIGFYGLEAQGRRVRSVGASAPVWSFPASAMPHSSDRALLSTAIAWPIRIYGSATVVAPQIMTLPDGSLISHASEAVGGLSATAKLDALKLAASLSDHQHVLASRLTTDAPKIKPTTDTAADRNPS